MCCASRGLGRCLLGCLGSRGFLGISFLPESTVIVLKTLEERGDSDYIHGRAMMGILVFQDLVVFR